MYVRTDTWMDRRDSRNSGLDRTCFAVLAVKNIWANVCLLSTGQCQGSQLWTLYSYSFLQPLRAGLWDALISFVFQVVRFPLLFENTTVK